MKIKVLILGCAVGLLLCSFGYSESVSILSEEQLSSRYGAACLKCRKLVSSGEAGCAESSNWWCGHGTLQRPPCDGDCSKSCPSQAFYERPTGSRDIRTWNGTCPMGTDYTCTQVDHGAGPQCQCTPDGPISCGVFPAAEYGC